MKSPLDEGPSILGIVLALLFVIALGVVLLSIAVPWGYHHPFGKKVGVPEPPPDDSIWTAPVPASARELGRSGPGHESGGYPTVERAYLTPLSAQQIDVYYAEFGRRFDAERWPEVRNELPKARGETSRMWRRPYGSRPLEVLWMMLNIGIRETIAVPRHGYFGGFPNETFSYRYYTYFDGNGSSDQLPANVGSARLDGELWEPDDMALGWMRRGNGILVLTYSGNVHRDPRFVQR